MKHLRLVFNPLRHCFITVVSAPHALADPARRALGVVAQAGITAVTIPGWHGGALEKEVIAARAASTITG